MTQTETIAKCTVEPAAENEKGVVAGLVQQYLKETSPLTGATTAGNGRYQYPALALYWKDSGRHPFLIRVGKRVAGFALVRQFSSGTQLAEFYIAPEHRRQRHGLSAAHQLFDLFPGHWAVFQLLDNSQAQTFWRRAIKTYKSGSYGERIETVKDKTYTVQRFEA